jgi:hypothetical protein
VKKVAVCVVTFLAIVVLMRAGTARSQQVPGSTTVSSGGSGLGSATGTTTVNAAGQSQNPFGTTVYQESSARGEIAQLLTKLREAEGDAARVELSKQLEEAIAKYFDDDMKTRESELTKLEERVSKLRSQLDRRRRAKQEIIQLQLKVLMNEADGLGFSGALLFEPNRRTNSAADFYYYNEGGQTGGGSNAVKSSTRSAPAKTEAKTETRK